MTITSILAAGTALAYLALLAWALRKNPQGQRRGAWLSPVASLALISSAVAAFASPRPVSLNVYLNSALLLAFGVLVLHALEKPEWLRPWIIAGGLWLALLILLDLSAGNAGLGRPDWLEATFAGQTLAGLLTLAGWAVIGGVLLAQAFGAFYRAHLPELANRALYWAVLTPLLLVGVLLGSSGWPLLMEGGWLITLAGVGAAAYGIATLRIFDVRQTLRLSLGILAHTLLAALTIWLALLAAQTLALEGPVTLLLLGALALVAAAVYVPLQRLVELAGRWLFGQPDRVTPTLRRYSQQASVMLDTEAIAQLATQTLASVLRAHPGGLLLITPAAEGQLEIEPLLVYSADGVIPDQPGTLNPGGPVFKSLFVEQRPLRQFDLEYEPDYAAADSAALAFLKQLRLAAYAPIIVDGQPAGLLASGPKQDDRPFNRHDLDVMATVASQTGTALRNAHLVADLRRLNLEMEAANEHLARLDSVKTDFITIASHELRTPLAQIRGYSDIIDGLSEQNMLEPGQISGLTRNLRSAAERMEELISAMLDVSKIDVNVMDLRFAQASLEMVLKLAIEPLTEAILARKITLSARGLRGLPPLEADLKRLVQAFQNIVSNAVKFTPDGGLINIQARLVEQDDDRPDEIHVQVTDTGVGLDPANQPLVFEKFFRVADPGLHSTGSTKFMGAGPGLGLTIARGVIEGHGGHITVESAGYDPVNFPGTTFTIVLPVTPPADARRVLPFEETTLSMSAEDRTTLVEAVQARGQAVQSEPAK